MSWDIKGGIQSVFNIFGRDFYDICQRNELEAFENALMELAVYANETTEEKDMPSIKIALKKVFKEGNLLLKKRWKQKNDVISPDTGKRESNDKIQKKLKSSKGVGYTIRLLAAFMENIESGWKHEIGTILRIIIKLIINNINRNSSLIKCKNALITNLATARIQDTEDEVKDKAEEILEQMTDTSDAEKVLEQLITKGTDGGTELQTINETNTDNNKNDNNKNIQTEKKLERNLNEAHNNQNQNANDNIKKEENNNPNNNSDTENQKNPKITNENPNLNEPNNNNEIINDINQNKKDQEITNDNQIKNNDNNNNDNNNNNAENDDNDNNNEDNNNNNDDNNRILDEEKQVENKYVDAEATVQTKLTNNEMKKVADQIGYATGGS